MGEYRVLYSYNRMDKSKKSTHLTKKKKFKGQVSYHVHEIFKTLHKYINILIIYYLIYIYIVKQ